MSSLAQDIQYLQLCMNTAELLVGPKLQEFDKGAKADHHQGRLATSCAAGNPNLQSDSNVNNNHCSTMCQKSLSDNADFVS